MPLKPEYPQYPRTAIDSIDGTNGYGDQTCRVPPCRARHRPCPAPAAQGIIPCRRWCSTSLVPAGGGLRKGLGTVVTTTPGAVRRSQKEMQQYVAPGRRLQAAAGGGADVPPSRRPVRKEVQQYVPPGRQRQENQGAAAAGAPSKGGRDNAASRFGSRGSAASVRPRRGYQQATGRRHDEEELTADARSRQAAEAGPPGREVAAAFCTMDSRLDPDRGSTATSPDDGRGGGGGRPQERSASQSTGVHVVSLVIGTSWASGSSGKKTAHVHQCLQGVDRSLSLLFSAAAATQSDTPTQLPHSTDSRAAVDWHGLRCLQSTSPGQSELAACRLTARTLAGPDRRGRDHRAAAARGGRVSEHAGPG